jgi:hypothetical protein
MRKTTLLKGSNIYIGEDFSKRVRDQRTELQKFMRQSRSRRPGAKFTLQYDKLFIDKDVYMYNDLAGQVEQVHHGEKGMTGGGGGGSSNGETENDQGADQNRIHLTCKAALRV